MEIWKDIDGFDGFYQVSNKGRVRSLDRESCGKKWVGKILSNRVSRGYPIVILCKDGQKKPIRIHRLVAFAFLGICEDKTDVNHIDGNTMNNDISNLEWTTHRENTDHSWKSGLTKQPPKNKEIAVIRVFVDGSTIRYASIKEASTKSGVCSGDISRCCKGKRKTAGGQGWKYEMEERI